MTNYQRKEKFYEFITEFSRDKIAVFSLIIVFIVLLMAIFAPLFTSFTPHDREKQDMQSNALLPPMSKERQSLPSQSFTILPIFDEQQKLTNVKGIDGYSLSKDNEQITLTFFPQTISFETVTISNLPPKIDVANGKRHPVTKKYVINDSGNTLVFNGDVVLFDKINLKIKPAPIYSGRTFILGTDEYGRDLFSSILYGTRISLFAALVSGGIALFIGVSLGLTSAWYGGRIDSIIMRIVDLQQSFPAILIGLLILAILGQGLFNVILALIIVQWVFYVRTVRSIVLVEKNKDYIHMAKMMRLPDRVILFGHFLPNCMPQILVLMTTRIAAAVTLEATYSFLGMGLPPDKPSLGTLISIGYEYILSGKFWISFYPGLVLAIFIIVVNLVGDRLRDMLNPFLKT